MQRIETPIKIGTRHSQLALWQANWVKEKLEKQGYAAELVLIQSSGDLNLTQPLHEMGSTGIFTKALDQALITGEVDLAVHSLKDVPTAITPELKLAAVLPRGEAEDILLWGPKARNEHFAPDAVVATGSLRRRAQWLARYPGHQVVNLRGNVQSRLEKLKNSSWGGAIFAKTGLTRAGLLPPRYLNLEWMLPAPAQGAVAALSRADDGALNGILATLNDAATARAVTEERRFLQRLEGGCSAPIGAHCQIQEGRFQFVGGLFAIDGSQSLVVKKEGELSQLDKIGIRAAEEVLQKGGEAIMREIRGFLNHV